jgi:hypothetical protein
MPAAMKVLSSENKKLSTTKATVESKMLPSYERLQSSEDSSRQVSHDDSCEKSYVQEDIVKCFKTKNVFHFILILSITLNTTLIYAHNYGTKGLVQPSKYGKKVFFFTV